MLTYSFLGVGRVEAPHLTGPRSSTVAKSLALYRTCFFLQSPLLSRLRKESIYLLVQNINFTSYSHFHSLISLFLQDIIHFHIFHFEMQNIPD